MEGFIDQEGGLKITVVPWILANFGWKAFVNFYLLAHQQYFYIDRDMYRVRTGAHKKYICP